jgi:hypothetical protein
MMNKSKQIPMLPIVIVISASILGGVALLAKLPKPPTNAVADAPTPHSPPKSSDALLLIYKQQALRNLYKGVPAPPDFARRARDILASEVKAGRMTCDRDLGRDVVTVFTCDNSDGLKIEGRFKADGSGEVLFKAPSGDSQLLSSG